MSTTSTPPSNAIVKYMGGNIFFYWFLSFITCGLYFYFYQNKFNGLSRKLNMEITGRRLGTYFTLSLLLRIVAIIVPFMATGNIDESNVNATKEMVLEIIFPLSILLAIVFEAMWSYRARTVLRMYVFMNYRVTLDVNRFLLFFFPGYTLTMAISHIEGEVAISNNTRTDAMNS